MTQVWALFLYNIVELNWSIGGDIFIYNLFPYFCCVNNTVRRQRADSA